jgi:hypothetical protein
MKLSAVRDELESEIRERLGPPLAETEWGYLVEKSSDLIARAEIFGSEGIEDLVAEIAQGRDSFRGEARRDRPLAERMADVATLTERASTHADAVGAILAAEASRRDDVAGFRREVLRGKLVRRERVERWIQRRAASGERIERRVLGTPGEPGFETIDGLPVIRRYVETIEYATPDERFVQHAGSTTQLEPLRQLSVALAKHYGWQPAQATVFVLTGAAPIVSPVRVQTAIPRAKASARIKLDIDPTVTPREISRHYAHARSNLISERPRRSERTYRLAIFADAHPEGTWGERMNVWNDEHPDARYNHANNFQRDATRALSRVLDPPLRMGGEAG